MRNPDRGRHIFAFAIAALIVGMIFEYSFAKAAEAVATPFHPAIGLSANAPDGRTIPLSFAVLKDGYATEAQCMSKKGIDSPKFHAFVKKLGLAVSEKLGGAKITAVSGCVDITKLPKQDDAAPAPPADEGQPKFDKL